MGNCLVLEDKVIKIMKMDGKILEYKPPLQVHQVLSEYSGYAISDGLPVHRHLAGHADMRCGRLYYLLPPPLRPCDNDRKASNGSNPTLATAEEERESGVVRIKMVITKQELRDMLAKGGLSADKLISQFQNKPSADDAKESCGGWKPALESIPEGSD